MSRRGVKGMEASSSAHWQEVADEALEALSDAIQAAAVDWSMALPARWPTMTAAAGGRLAIVAGSGTDHELQAVAAWIADIERLDRVRGLLAKSIRDRD
jgi:predicted alpha/beta hydrolase family esterase